MALQQLYNEVNVLLDKDAERVHGHWEQQQHVAVAQWAEEQRRIASERRLVSDRFVHSQQHITASPGAEALMATLHEVNETIRLLDDAYVTSTATQEFVRNYEALLTLWKTMYKQTEKLDARLSPGAV